ncbi:hypothetical protein [Ensifer adhaerens]|uniref:hypothetical protein n=1 Tax=Ensifer adhaerens TaxID=106592 RepID=UPI000CF0D458|nr:hypothetical protein [Ensifer adhaerens]
MKRAITDHATGTREAHDRDRIILGSDARPLPHNFGEASIAGRPPDEAFLLLEPGADPVFRTHVAGSVVQALVVGHWTARLSLSFSDIGVPAAVEALR